MVHFSFKYIFSYILLQFISFCLALPNIALYWPVLRSIQCLCVSQKQQYQCNTNQILIRPGETRRSNHYKESKKFSMETFSIWNLISGLYFFWIHVFLYFLAIHIFFVWHCPVLLYIGQYCSVFIISEFLKNSNTNTIPAF